MSLVTEEVKDINEDLEKVYLSSFNGNLCNYRDIVTADGVNISHIFAGEDCYADNCQEDESREADIDAIDGLVKTSQVIVVTYHDRYTGNPEESITYRKVNDGWVKEFKYWYQE